MNRTALLRGALWALLRNKMRSVLTVLGVTIGIAAVICVVAIGKAGQAQVEQQLNNLGDNFVWIEAGGRWGDGVRTGTHGTKTLTLGDAAAIKSQISLIKSVSPNVDASVQIIYGNQNWFTSYRGVSPEYFDIKRWYTDQGAVFSQDDVERAADVCVLGAAHRRGVGGAGGGRDRDHERDARLGHRAHPRDRGAGRGRRDRAGDPAPVPGRVGAAQPGGRRRGSGGRRRRVAGGGAHARGADADVARGGAGRGALLDRGGRLLRLLPGAEGLAARPDRGVAIRMIPSRKWLIPLGGVALIGVLVILGSGRRTQPQYFTAKVERGDLHDAVEATGTVNAVVTVQVGSQVSGTILRLKADFNTRVRKGDVIAEIEPSVFQGALLQASADLESARANVEVAQANLEKAKATLVQTKADYERNERLAKGEMISPQQLEAARAAYDEATASVGAAQAGVTQARAMVSQKTAAVAVSRTNLDHTVIRSPIDGIVVARSVDVGQTVAASLQAPTIFTIAQDLTKMRVYAKTDESDVGSIRAGQPVSFKVDAFPKDRFQGVVTYDTVIEFENKDLKLFPGMTAYVTIPVASAQNVLKVPNGALRYRPSLGAEEIRAQIGRASCRERV